MTAPHPHPADTVSGAPDVQPDSTQASPPGPPIALRLGLSRQALRAPGCVRATVRASNGATLHVRIDVHPGDGVDVVVTHGRGTAKLCLGWTGAPWLRLRASAASAASAASSRAVRLRIRPGSWMQDADRLLAGLPVSVSIRRGRRPIYSRLGDIPRAPASNEKLLLSMALLDRLGPRTSIPTTAEAASVRGGVVHGDLWLVGHGDPEVDAGTLATLARRVRRSGIRVVRGSVVGDTSTFSRERSAPGWHRIALDFISIPTALTFEANADGHGFVLDPERRAAAALTRALTSAGVRVRGRPDAGSVPAAARPRARVRSSPLIDILRRQNLASSNLDAEVLDKLLGAMAAGPPGSIEKGAAAIEAWAARHGVDVVARDGAGLSYADRVTTDGMVDLLCDARRSPWGAAFRSTLPPAGRGTLAGRLAGVPVRAKTGTLIHGVSALSGWVRLERSGRWAEFSILSSGLAKERAVAVEDTVVSMISRRA
jgi:serine-type D-Ala-D-Ala carboxypeptidase/endopeptidase (penicillin-binding protein 4)